MGSGYIYLFVVLAVGLGLRFVRRRRGTKAGSYPSLWRFQAFVFLVIVSFGSVALGVYGLKHPGRPGMLGAVLVLLAGVGGVVLLVYVGVVSRTGTRIGTRRARSKDPIRPGASEGEDAESEPSGRQGR